jgi:hypothetical protein
MRGVVHTGEGWSGCPPRVAVVDNGQRGSRQQLVPQQSTPCRPSQTRTMIARNPRPWPNEFLLSQPASYVEKKTMHALTPRSYTPSLSKILTLPHRDRPRYSLAFTPSASFFARSRNSLRSILPDYPAVSAENRIPNDYHAVDGRLTGFLGIASTKTTPPSSCLARETRSASQAAMAAASWGVPAEGEPGTM